MPTITAIIRVKSGTEQATRNALLVVADNVLNEPQTIGFFVSHHSVDPCPLTTRKCLTNQAKGADTTAPRPWRAPTTSPCRCSGLRRPPHAVPSPNLRSNRDPSCRCFGEVFAPPTP